MAVIQFWVHYVCDLQKDPYKMQMDIYQYGTIITWSIFSENHQNGHPIGCPHGGAIGWVQILGTNSDDVLPHLLQCCIQYPVMDCAVISCQQIHCVNEKFLDLISFSILQVFLSIKPEHMYVLHNDGNNIDITVLFGLEIFPNVC